MSTLSNIRKKLIEHEGTTDHMYLDSTGHVTVGNGYLISNINMATQLFWINRKTRSKATYAEIVKAYNTISRMPNGNYRAAYYKSKTNIYISNATIGKLLDKRLQEKQQELRKVLPLDDYPILVQEVLISMAYQLGTSGLVRKFPKFIAAIKKKDWEAASKQCHVSGISHKRNEERKNKLILAGFLEGFSFMPTV